MGVKLGGLFEARRIAIDDLAGRRIAIDGHNILYQFLSSIRSRQGEPLSSVTKVMIASAGAFLALLILSKLMRYLKRKVLTA